MDRQLLIVAVPAALALAAADRVGVGAAILCGVAIVVVSVAI